jgi:uncharacterized Zn finger protein (UPF0148 family)
MESKPITLQDRVERLVSEIGVELEESAVKKLKLGMVEIIKRVSHPEAYCPKCDENMFPNSKGEWECINCGYIRVKEKAVTTPESMPQEKTQRPLPKEAEKVLNAVENEASRVVKPTGMGEAILKLRNSMDGGVQPTAEDTARVLNDKGVASKQINWV